MIDLLLPHSLLLVLDLRLHALHPPNRPSRQCPEHELLGCRNWISIGPHRPLVGDVGEEPVYGSEGFAYGEFWRSCN